MPRSSQPATRKTLAVLLLMLTAARPTNGQAPDAPPHRESDTLECGEGSVLDVDTRVRSELNPFGPFPLRFMDSLSLLFYQAPADLAATLGRRKWKFSLNTSYASLFAFGANAKFQFERDAEWLRSEWRTQFGVTDNLEIGLSLAFHYASAGFLDGFINAFHETTRLGPTGRPEGQYHDRLAIRGETLLAYPEHSFEFADLPIEVKYAILRDGTDPFGLSLRAGLELPTGRVEHSAGSGKVEGGLGLLFEKKVSRFAFYSSVDAIFLDTPSTFERNGAKVNLASFMGTLAIEWRATDWFALATQLDGAPPILEGTKITALERPRMTLAFGGHVRLGDHVFARLALVEDVVSSSSADVTFFFSLSVAP